MIPNAVETAKDAMLRTFAAQLRVERPSLTHARSYQLAQEQHPELREEFADSEAPAAASQGYRYDPSKPPAADQAKLDELLSRFMPKKVEARKPREREKEKTMLVYAKSGELLGEVIFD